MSVNTYILGVMTEGITNKISLSVEKENIPDLFGCYYFYKQQDWLDVWKTIRFVFYFSSILDYMYLFPKKNYTRGCCLTCKYCALVCTHTNTHKTRRNKIYEEFWISRTPRYLEVFPRSLQLRDRGILL
jgi:hypothetical protein